MLHSDQFPFGPCTFPFPSRDEPPDSWAEVYDGTARAPAHDINGVNVNEKNSEKNDVNLTPTHDVNLTPTHDINLKPTNPKDAVGIRKVAMSCVSGPFLSALGVAMTEGALKYGRHNYRGAGVRSSVYYDALWRHILAWWEGEDIDPESNLPHVIKAAACLAVLFDSMAYGNLNDDRPPKYANGWLGKYNEATKVLLDKYPSPPLPFTERDRTWTRPGSYEDAEDQFYARKLP